MMETCHAYWLQVLVDGKRFRPAITDFDKALELYPGGCAAEVNAHCCKIASARTDQDCMF